MLAWHEAIEIHVALGICLAGWLACGGVEAASNRKHNENIKRKYRKWQKKLGIWQQYQLMALS